MEKDTNIELRSEALRNVIGQVPPLLVRVGTMVIVFIMLALALVVCFVPYPITIKSVFLHLLTLRSALRKNMVCCQEK